MVESHLRLMTSSNCLPVVYRREQKRPAHFRRSAGRLFFFFFFLLLLPGRATVLDLTRFLHLISTQQSVVVVVVQPKGS